MNSTSAKTLTPPPPIETAAKYLKLGYAVLPVPFRRKGPVIDGWTNLRLGLDDLPAYFNEPQLNIGILLGEPSGRLTDIDLDVPEAVLLAPHFLPGTEMRFGRPSSLDSHWEYIVDDGISTLKLQDPIPRTAEGKRSYVMLLEIRSTGCQTVAPGSVHESGELIAFSSEGKPAHVKAVQLRSSCRRLAAAVLLSRYWPDGARQDAALALSGGLLRGGWDPATVAHFVSAVALAANDEELTKRATAGEYTARRLEAGRETTGWPALARLLPEAVVGRARDWLGFARERQELSANGNRASSSSQDRDDGPLRVVRMADIAPESVRWLWYPYLPLGKLIILQGVEGLGKSWLLCALAAAITCGRGLPGMPPFEPSTVLLMSAEDGLADTIRPRLEAAGANLTRVLALNEPLTLDEAGLLRLEGCIIENKPVLVAIDPLFAYTGAKMNINQANECRSLSAALAAIAERHGCAIVAVRHLNKSRGYGDPSRAGIGSVDWRAAARSELLIGTDPGNPRQRILAHSKCNLAPLGPSLTYEIRDDGFFWVGGSQLTASDVLVADMGTADDRSALAEAEDFLRDVLADGKRDAKEVIVEARGAGISETTLRRAQKRLSIKPRKEGFGAKQRWFWTLPEDSRGKHEDGQSNNLDHLSTNDAVKEFKSNSIAEGGQDHFSNHLSSEDDHLRGPEREVIEL